MDQKKIKNNKTKRREREDHFGSCIIVIQPWGNLQAVYGGDVTSQNQNGYLCPNETDDSDDTWAKVKIQSK